jgi:hypothetical protein
MKAPAPTLATLMKSRRGNVVDVSPSPAMLAGAGTGGTEGSESVMIQWQEEETRDYGVVRSRNQTIHDAKTTSSRLSPLRVRAV